MSNLTPDEIDRIYQRIEKQMRQRFDCRAEYFSHMAAFVVAILAGLWLNAQSWMPSWGSSLVIIIILLWGIGVAVHSIQYVFSEMKNRAIARELERSGISDALHAYKYKREERLVRLDDEGELVDIDPFDTEDDEAAHYRA